MTPTFQALGTAGVQESSRADALSVWCPICGVQPGQACVNQLTGFKHGIPHIYRGMVAKEDA
jgi:hypothetical protein